MTAMLEVKNLQRQIDKLTIINSVTAQVKPGDVIALLGKNGAGKTTLLETLLGFAFPSYGSVELWGEQATAIKGATKQRIGFVPQQSELLLSLTGADTLALFKTYRSHWNQALVDRLVAEWLIPMETRIGKMSVGQQQKLSILLALAHEPELLVLDEPVASLDPIARRQFLQQLVEIAADENRAVIFSTHIISDVERVANQVWMLRAGELVYQGELDSLKESMARVTLHAQAPLPRHLGLANVINQRVQGNHAVVTLQAWQPELAQQLAETFGADVTVEHLGLEDIFLEMNHEYA